MKDLFFKIAQLFSVFECTILSSHIDYLSMLLRTGYKSRGFKHIGKGVLFSNNVAFHEKSNISIGDRTNIGSNSVIATYSDFLGVSYSPFLDIGDECHFGEYNHISCINSIHIGDGFLSGKWVTITDNSHGITNIQNMSTNPWNRKLFSKGAVVIGKNVWLGDKVTVLPGVTIGDGVIVGANSVVTKDIPSYCVACGNPAKVVKIIK